MGKYITFIFLTVLMAGSAWAQGTGDMARNQYMAEYEKTNQVIERARSVIQQTGTDKGKALLEMAIALQEKARESAQQGYYGMAGKLTMEAREKAHAAIAVALQAEENENLVQRQLEKTDNLIARVRNKIGRNTPEAVERIFDAARENQRKAWEFFRNQRLRPALKMTRQAERMIKGLIEKAQEEKGDLQRLRTQERQLEQRMEQVRERLAECGSDEAAQLIVRAETRIQEANRFAEEGKIGQAENSFKMAQKMTRQAENLCGDQATLEMKINQLRKRLEIVVEAEKGSENGNLEKLINSVQEHLRKATRLCAEGDSEECAANIKAAEMSMIKAEKMLGLQ